VRTAPRAPPTAAVEQVAFAVFGEELEGGE